MCTADNIITDVHEFCQKVIYAYDSKSNPRHCSFPPQFITDCNSERIIEINFAKLLWFTMHMVCVHFIVFMNQVALNGAE